MDLNQYVTDATRTESLIDSVRVNELLFVAVMQQMVLMGGVLDQIKKNAFYGDKKPYNFEGIQQAIAMSHEHLITMATLTEDEIVNQKRSLDVNPRLFHGIVGMMTEAVELLEAMQIYGDDWDTTNLLEEIGDSSWYQAILVDELGGNWDDILNRNIEKLRKRFPEKFTSDNAIHRDIDGEREILDKIQRD